MNLPAEIGIRIDDEDRNLKVGDYFPDSRIWVDNEPTDELLDGTSAREWTEDRLPSKADCDRIMGSYYGDYIYVLGSDYAYYGQDDDEIVMKDAVILAIYKR